MNDPFQQLRELAENKRDQSVKSAKAEYAETLQKIAELQKI